jgi:hypothetical protein
MGTSAAKQSPPAELLPADPIQKPVKYNTFRNYAN